MRTLALLSILMLAAQAAAQTRKPIGPPPKPAQTPVRARELEWRAQRPKLIELNLFPARTATFVAANPDGDLVGIRLVAVNRIVSLPSEAELAIVTPEGSRDSVPVAMLTVKNDDFDRLLEFFTAGYPSTMTCTPIKGKSRCKLDSLHAGTAVRVEPLAE